jgi:hypothetical protein
MGGAVMSTVDRVEAVQNGVELVDGLLDKVSALAKEAKVARLLLARLQIELEKVHGELAQEGSG